LALKVLSLRGSLVAPDLRKALRHDVPGLPDARVFLFICISSAYLRPCLTLSLPPLVRPLLLSSSPFEGCGPTAALL